MSAIGKRANVCPLCKATRGAHTVTCPFYASAARVEAPPSAEDVLRDLLKSIPNRHSSGWVGEVRRDAQEKILLEAIDRLRQAR